MSTVPKVPYTYLYRMSKVSYVVSESGIHTIYMVSKASYTPCILPKGSYALAMAPSRGPKCRCGAGMLKRMRAVPTSEGAAAEPATEGAWG